MQKAVIVQPFAFISCSVKHDSDLEIPKHGIV